MKQLIEQLLKQICFGKPAKGEKLPPPTVRRVDPPVHLSESEWNREMKFGSRYGTRGSFYQYR